MTFPIGRDLHYFGFTVKNLLILAFRMVNPVYVGYWRVYVSGVSLHLQVTCTLMGSNSLTSLMETCLLSTWCIG